MKKFGEIDNQLYLLGDFVYLSGLDLLKIFKRSIIDPNFFYKRKFNKSINSKRVAIVHTFGALKNRWKILKNFNIEIIMATTVTVAYCIFHNFCEIYSKRISLPKDVDRHHNHFIRVCIGAMRLPSKVTNE